METPESDSVRDQRLQFVQSLVEFNHQRSLYSRRAGKFKARSQRLDLLVITCGVLIVALPILRPDATHWVDIAIACLGVGVVIAQGSLRVFRYGETWPEYRKASERMKRETRLFTNCIGEYADEEFTAQALYVTRLETIIAEEQSLFATGKA